MPCKQLATGSTPVLSTKQFIGRGLGTRQASKSSHVGFKSSALCTFRRVALNGGELVLKTRRARKAQGSIPSLSSITAPSINGFRS